MTPESRQNLTDRLVEGYVQFIWRHRGSTLFLLSVITAYWMYQGFTLRLCG